MGFFSILEERVREVNSLLCVGLDPHPDDLPEQTSSAAIPFCLSLIEATADVAAAYKPNVAFFEALGTDGLAALRSVIAAAPKGTPVILDAKRGDIASTAEAYAKAAFDVLGADAITVNPLLGGDAIEPFVRRPAKGVFLLCKTSNPGSADLQDLPVRAGGDRPLYEVIAQRAQQWNRNDNIGLVVGGTQPQALARVRQAAADLWILAPGVGAQGGDLPAAVQAGLRGDGLGMLVSVSRGISRAADPHKAARDLRDAINRQRESLRSEEAHTRSALKGLSLELADGLLQIGCVQFGSFTLKSGLTSPIYIDLRRLASYPRLLEQAAAAYVSVLHRLSFDRLAALPYAAIPIATAISLRTGWPMVYPRRESKTYGTQAAVEGEYRAGERVVVIDDLATTGGSKLEAIEKLAAAGLRVEDVAVLIDRQSGAGDALRKAGCRLHAVLTLTQLLDHWKQAQSVPSKQIAAVRAFLTSEGRGV